jgi:CheY-like chemotaxis protein
MEGEITIKSAVNQGTTVSVYIPQKTAGKGVLGKNVANSLQNFQTSPSGRASKAQIVYEPMPYGSILLVDDIITNLYVAEGILKPYQLQIETALSGQETIDKVNAGKSYDVIFMDHMMPEMDGIEATKRLRELGYTKPIVALTANAVAGQAEMFLQSGFDAFISKPIDIRVLNDVLKKYVRRDKQS